MTTSSSSHSVTKLFGPAAAGDADAVERLCAWAIAEVVPHIRLRGRLRKQWDPREFADDGARSFLKAREQGRYPDVADRNEFVKLLLGFIRRKISKALVHSAAQKRVGREVPLGGPEDSAGPADPAALAPELAAFLADWLERLPADLREMAALKFEDHSNASIAAQLQVSEHTIERRLRRLRLLWAMDHLLGDFPCDEAAQMQAECEELLRYLEDPKLRDPQLRRLAEMKRDGSTDGEISQALQRSPRDISRMLKLIRTGWRDYIRKEIK